MSIYGLGWDGVWQVELFVGQMIKMVCATEKNLKLKTLVPFIVLVTCDVGDCSFTGLGAESCRK